MRLRRLLLLLASVVLLLTACLNYNDPTQREMGRVLAYLLAAVGVVVVAVICFFFIRIGHSEGAWLLVGLISFLLTPSDIRVTVYSYFLVSFGLGAGVLVLLGELGANPPHFVKRMLSWFIAIGMLLILPWGIAYAFKYGLRPFFTLLAAPQGHHLGFWSYAGWFVLKIAILVGGSRLLDRALIARQKGVLYRLTLRTALIWGLGLVPFPHVFESLWGELLASAAPSSMVDGVFDLWGEDAADSRIFVSAALGVGVLLALPGTYALYADVAAPALGVVIALLFATLAARVFFLQFAYRILSWEDG